MAFGTPSFTGLVVPAAAQPITIAGPTAPRTWTAPDANFTVARTDAAQTFAGVQTFSDATDSTSAATGSLILAGGMGIEKSVYVGRGSATPTAAIVVQNGALWQIALGNDITSFCWKMGRDNAVTGDFVIRNVDAERLRITTAGVITFMGASSSFPGLKRSGTTLQHRLADDSADGPMSASTGDFSGAVTTTGRKVGASVKTTTYSMTTLDDVVVGNHATVAFTISLLAVSGNTGVRHTIKNKGAAVVTVDVTGGGSNIFTSSAVATVPLNAGDSITVVNDGAIWVVI